MNMSTFLRLGRVSNLPTVWTNALAGAVLAGAATVEVVVLCGVALTLFYVGGMWLNDAFDAEIDARERANRPIPMGEVSRGTVFLGGGAMLVAGIVVSFMAGLSAGLAGIALAAAVVAYDWLHKGTIFSPVIMGATRFLSYALAALAVGAFTGPALWGAVGLFAYIIGLTYAAKREAYDDLGAAWPLAALALPVIYAAWLAGGAVIPTVFVLVFVGMIVAALRLLRRRDPGDVPMAVSMMIAGVCFYDAALIAGVGQIGLAMLAAGGCLVTLGLQRKVAGT